MATHEFKTYLYYVERFSSPEKPFFTLTESDGMEAHGYTLVQTVPVTVELPDPSALTQQRLEALDAMEQQERAKFSRVIREIAERRASLLCIENHVEAA